MCIAALALVPVDAEGVKAAGPIAANQSAQIATSSTARACAVAAATSPSRQNAAIFASAVARYRSRCSAA